MKFLLSKQTKETKTRLKRFFAFMLSVLICCLPTATALAESITVTVNDDGLLVPNTNKLVGKTMDPGERFAYKNEYRYGSGNLYLYYDVNADGNYTNSADDHVEINHCDDSPANPDTKSLVIKNIGIAGYQHWSISNAEFRNPSSSGDPGILKIYLKPVKDEKPAQKEEKSEDISKRKHYDQTPTSWEANPNEISAFYIKNGFIDNKAKLGKEEQGETCQFIFRSSFPAGNDYKEAFSLSMSYDGKHTTDLKDGTLLLYIPPNLQRSGRKFKMLAINKDGEVFLFDNTSDNEGIFQTKLNVEGYAFCLIYTDEFILN